MITRASTFFRARRLADAKEKAAYWRGKAEIWGALCRGKHMSYERDKLAESRAKQLMYEERVRELTQR